MKICLKARDANSFCLKVLTWILVMPVFIDISNVVVNQFGIGNSSMFTALFYVITLAVVLLRGKLYLEDFVLLLLVYVPFAINYLFFDETRSYMTSVSMFMLYIFFLPWCVIVISHIFDWTDFFKYAAFFSMIAIVLSGIMMLFLDYVNYLVYMDFSYAILPPVCALYTYGRKSENKKWLYLLFAALGFIEMIAFGARAPILFAIAFLAFFEFFRSTKGAVIKIGLIVLAVGLFLTFETSILQWLESIPIFENSRFLEKWASGALLESDARDMIKYYCEERLRTMGMEISGFFGDRVYCRGEAYPHNIFYEILMTYGWIFGVIAILLLIVLLVKSILVKNSEKKNVALFIICSVGLRYLVSGSYIVEGKFWMALFVLLMVCSNKKSISERIRL